MGWFIDLIAYISSHHIAAIWFLIFVAASIFIVSHRIADHLDLPYKQKLDSEKKRLAKLSDELSAREALLSERELRIIEKEQKVHQSRPLRIDLNTLKASKISSFLPDLYDALSSPPYSEALAKRISSAVDGSVSIAGSFSCQALVRSDTNHTYQTSLTRCNCEDFIYRGGPCKHMLHLLFSITAQPPEPIVRSYQAVETLDKSTEQQYLKQLRNEKAARIQAERKCKTLQAESESEIAALQAQISDLQDTILHHSERLSKFLDSNLTSIPWLAGMMADFLTYDLEVEAKKLEWGSNIQRQKKVASIRDIRADARARIQEAKEAVYQLEYLRSLYPALDDILETDYKELNFTGAIPEYDPIRNYLSKEEWSALSPAEKDQLALDRYVQSKNKSNWQIGRDYELSVAYEYIHKGYHVDTFGNYMKFEDLGRDIIAIDSSNTLVIQCKYWSKTKTIHEKHIFQLYGTLVMYRLENQNLLNRSIHGVFVTNTALSPMARQVADLLDISVVEHHEMTEFPRIKCNIGHDEFGETRIYHLPMDSQYDTTQIKNPGEFYAFTVQEAIDAGFRRAYKWSGKN